MSYMTRVVLLITVIALAMVAVASFAQAGPSEIKWPLNSDSNQATDPFKIIRGDVVGASYIFKFGHNPSIVAVEEDIWAGGGRYTFFPDAAVGVECASTDVDDDGDPVGTGARTVAISGLDENWLEQAEVITMNGVTPVVLANTYLRIFRVVVLKSGTSDANEGTIFCEPTGGNDAVGVDDAAVILPGFGQTLQAIFTIPAGKSGVFSAGSFTVGEGKTASIRIYAHRNTADVFPDGAWTVGFLGSLFQNNYVFSSLTLGIVPEKTDVRFSAISSAAGTSIGATFMVYLFDN